MPERNTAPFEMEDREPPAIELTRKLLSYFLSGPFTPGERLPSERQLAESIGVGRAAVREALKALTLLGIVRQRHGGGTFLSSATSDLLPRTVEWGLLLGDQQLDDLIELRNHLEPTLAELAAARRTDEHVAALRTIHDAMAAAGDDFEAYVDLDVEFHHAIADAAGNKAMGDVLAGVGSLLHAWTHRVIIAASETSSSLKMHTPILRAIEAGDPAAARQAMEAHMERANRRLRASISDAPDLGSQSSALASVSALVSCGPLGPRTAPLWRPLPMTSSGSKRSSPRANGPASPSSPRSARPRSVTLIAMP